MTPRGRSIEGRGNAVRPGLVAASVGVAVGVAVAAVSGCSSEPTIDGARLEQNITADAAKTDLVLNGVSCPRSRAAVSGDRFSCTATLTGGGTLTYDVAITSAQGAYTYALAPGQLLDGAAIARDLTTDITTSNPALASAVVTCPTSVLSPGGTVSVDCTLAANGQEATLVVTADPGQPASWAFRR